MTRAETMTRAYIEAIYFTETGDTDQPDADAELTPLCKAQAYIDCRNFLWAIGAVPGGGPVPGAEDLDPEQLGHDLWLTRNGHGAGFWDRPEVYGEANATLFTRLAKAIGGHDAEFVEPGDAEAQAVRDAAPALLEALKAVTSCLENWVEIADAEDRRDYDDEALAQARAALVSATPKAEGGAS